MEFKVLGNFEIRHNEHMISIRSRRIQVLAATLVVRRNVSVATDNLIDHMWNGRPPKAARSAAQVYVYRLRRLLPESPEVALRTTPSGYVLEVPPEAVDLDRFEAAVKSGREDIKCGRVAEGISRLRAGLSLWRGEALADIHHDHLQAEARSLNEQRIAVWEETLYTELAMGRHNQILLELEGLVAAHPYREKLWEWLMLAFYRSGRQAEALQAYSQARQALVDQLGIEPGPELRKLQQAILAGTPSAGLVPVLIDARGNVLCTNSAPAMATLPEGRVDNLPALPKMRSPLVFTATVSDPLARFSPAELPPDIATFTGRRTELAQLREMLSPDGPCPVRTAVISGSAGVGKSTLATHAAHGLSAQFPDGVLYVNMQANCLEEQPLRLTDVLRRWLYHFDIPGADAPDNVEEAAAMFRSLTFSRRLLLVLDNVASTTQIRALLPAGPRCRTLVTTCRTTGPVNDAVELPLDPFCEEESLELLSRLVGQDRAEQEPEALRSIARFCENLPLALRSCAARLAAHRGCPISYLAHRLEDDRHRLDELTNADLNPRGALAVCFQQLRDHDPDGWRAAHLFRLLGLLNRQSIDLATAVALTKTSMRGVENMLEKLVEFQLLEPPADGYTYPIPGLVRLFAREQVLEEVSRQDCYRCGSRDMVSAR